MRAIVTEWLHRILHQADGAEGGGGGDGAAGSAEGGSAEGTGSGEGNAGEGAGGDGSSDGSGGTGEGGDSLLTGGDAGEGGDTLLTGGKDEGGAGGEGKPEDGAGAPESYTDFTVPTGTQISEEQLAAFTPVAKELGLTQEQAQKLVDLQMGEVDRQQAARDADIAGWLTELKADKDVGGAAFGDNVKKASEFLRRASGEGFGELKDVLEQSGLGNHPAVFKFILNMANVTSEDSFSGPGRKGADGSEKSQLKKQYPTMPDSAFG